MKRMLALALLFAFCAGARAQSPATGFPPYSSIESGVADTTNRYDLNTNIALPIMSSQGRGMNLQLAAVYDSALWKIKSGAWVSVTDQLGSPTWGWNKTSPTGIVGNTSSTTTCEIFPQKIIYTVYSYSAFWYRDASGTIHNFPTVNFSYNPCTDTETGTSSGFANDGSGYFITVSSAGSADLYTSSGIYIIPGIEIMDTNGNQITSTVVSGSETDWKDSAGHNALKIVSSSGNIQYQTLDPTGVYRTTTLTLTSYNIKTNFGCSGITEYTGTASLPSSITLPNGLSYSFTYEGTPSHSGYYTGRISQITLPNGGYVQYQYNSPNDGINCTDGSIMNLTRTQNDGSTSSVWTFSRAANGSNWVTTITAPLMPYDTAPNQSVRTFNSSGQETAGQFYQGSATSGTLLRTVNMTWASNGSPATKTTILEDNHQSEVETTYDSNGNLQVMKEHDYGSGAPGPVVRTTNYSYLATTAYTSLNIIDRVITTTISDSTGTIKYRQDIAYDGTTISPCPTGAAQHNDVGHGCSYTTRGNPTSFTTYTNAAAPSGGLTKNKYYDLFGNLVKADDDSSQTIGWNFSSTTQYSYPDSAIRGPASGPQLSTGYTHNAYTGMLASITDSNNQTTSFAYDFMKRVTTTTRPDLAQIVQSYDDTQHSTTISTPVQGTAVQKHTAYQDGFARVVQDSTLDASGAVYSVTATQYDAMDRPYRVSNPYTASAQYWTQTTYDALGRQLKTIMQDGSQFAYSYAGPSVTVNDPSSHQTKTQSDGLNRMNMVYEPDPNNGNSLTLQTSYSYSVLDNESVVTQGAQTRSFTYDGMGRLTSQVLPESGATSFQYNSSNLVSQRTDARGVITTYSYDSLNRPYQVIYNVGSTGVPATPIVTYAYGTSATLFNNGQLLTITDGVGTVTYAYDSLQRPTQAQHTINGTAYTTSYQYNLAGAVSAITYPSGRIVQQSYDSIGRLSALSSGTTTYANNFSYNPAFYATTFTYGNGVVATIGYSPDRLQLQSLNYTGTTTAFSAAYSRNQNGGNNGQITGITDSVDAGRTITYTFDSLNRIATAVTTGSTNYPKWGLSFTYDRYGNRTAQTVTSGTANSNSVAVDPSTNHIVTAGYSYDASGNLTGDGNNTLTYDAENRIVSVVNGSGSASYAYRASGHRAMKTTGGITTVSLYDADHEIADYVTGSLNKEYVYLGEQALAIYVAGTLYYEVSDHQSARVHMDASGTVVGQKGQYPYGEDWYPSSIGDRHFTTYARDSESINDYAIHRFFVNRLGRFSAIDSDGGSPEAPQTLNRYVYGKNDPVNTLDFDGKMPVGGGGGGGGGGSGPCEAVVRVGPQPLERKCVGGGEPRCGDEVCPPPPLPPIPPPPPEIEKCFAQVKFRPVAHTEGIANHSFWWVQDFLEQHYIMSAGPQPSDLVSVLTGHSKLNEFSNPGDASDHFNKPGTADNKHDKTWFKTNESSAVCFNVATIEALVRAWPDNTIRYNIFGPNSNTYTHYLGTLSLLLPVGIVGPPRAVGWNALF